MSYNKTVNDFQFRWIQGLINPWNMIFISDASVNIMFYGLINPCIHLIESHQLYIIDIMLFNNNHMQCIKQTRLKNHARFLFIAVTIFRFDNL